MVKNMPKKYYTRIIENELDQMLGIFGAVLIEGPKWCGKTTTAGTRAASRLLLMDPSRNFENRLRAETDPALAVSGEVPRLIDEWQEVPKLWDAARFECDNRGTSPETTHRFRKLQSLDLVHKPMLPTAASKLFRWMCSRRNAVGEVKLTPQFLDLVSEI